MYYTTKVVGFQVKYLLDNGSEVIGTLQGTDKNANLAIISLKYTQFVSRVSGEVNSNNVMTMVFDVKDLRGNVTTWGPYGNTGTSGAKPYTFNATG